MVYLYEWALFYIYRERFPEIKTNLENLPKDQINYSKPYYPVFITTILQDQY